jgi:hypothetical protein
VTDVSELRRDREFAQDFARRMDPLRAHILDTAVEHGLLEARDDGYLYVPEGDSPRTLARFLTTEWWTWRSWTRAGRGWKLAGRAIQRELEEHGRINPLEVDV